MGERTPGPWKVVDTEEGEHICTTWDHPQLGGPAPVVGIMYGGGRARIYISEADAALIAAAPDMLAALEEIAALPRDYTSPEVFERKVREAARAAIAKAKQGEAEHV